MYLPWWNKKSRQRTHTYNHSCFFLIFHVEYYAWIFLNMCVCMSIFLCSTLAWFYISSWKFFQFIPAFSCFLCICSLLAWFFMENTNTHLSNIYTHIQSHTVNVIYAFNRKSEKICSTFLSHDSYTHSHSMLHTNIKSISTHKIHTH